MKFLSIYSLYIYNRNYDILKYNEVKLDHTVTMRIYHGYTTNRNI